MDYATFVAENLNRIKERIALAAQHSGRNPTQVCLVAVSKTFPVDAMQLAYEAGQRDFGENRPEEGSMKIPLFLENIEGTPPTWHMIGHIQSRKASLVIAHFDIVHSIDRLSIAARLSRLAQQAKRIIPVLLECNVSGEISKYGYAAAGWENNKEILEEFIAAAGEVINLPGLRVIGLMTMPPLVEDSEDVRAFFASLRALRDELNENYPDAELSQLSMGMSNDYEVAVEEGATLVRVGRAIFGERR
jgi:pyridoxal phosphate enzyme (YggS family)